MVEFAVPAFIVAVAVSSGYLLRAWEDRYLPLARVLRFHAGPQVIQMRPTADFEKVPAALIGWMFLIPNFMVTNISPKQRLSLVFSLELRTATGSPIRIEDIFETTGRELWKSRYPNYIASPAIVEPHHAITGSLAFWLPGAVGDGNLSEKLRRRSGWHVDATLEMKDLITGNIIRHPVPSVELCHQA